MTIVDRDCDVAVVGAGLAGTCAARVLLAQGIDVALIDARPHHPNEFRAEKLGATQMDQFDRLGLGDSARTATTRMDDLAVVRFGSLVTRERKREYGFAYADLVNQLRADLPEGFSTIVGRVDGIAAEPGRTTLALADGRRIRARIVVVSTGLGRGLLRGLGISHEAVSLGHSLSVGFDMATPADAFPFDTLTYYTEGVGSRMAYLTLFPIGPTMRANLFAYRGMAESWTADIRERPEAALAAAFPNLARVCRASRVRGRVQIRPIDLVRAADPARDGVVLIGDAFSTACPIPGTGIGKVLVDVERLCSVHIPRWLGTGRIDRAAVEDFYRDPVKAANDASSLHLSFHARALFTSRGLPWAARRGRHFVSRHMRNLVARRGRPAAALAASP